MEGGEGKGKGKGRRCRRRWVTMPMILVTSAPPLRLPFLSPFLSLFFLSLSLFFPSVFSFLESSSLSELRPAGQYRIFLLGWGSLRPLKFVLGPPPRLPPFIYSPPHSPALSGSALPCHAQLFLPSIFFLEYCGAFNFFSFLFFHLHLK